MQNGKRKTRPDLIVGETSRAENFLNGYQRETNPRLAKDNVVYSNTASCGSNSRPSAVPPGYTREHYKEERQL